MKPTDDFAFESDQAQLPRSGRLVGVDYGTVRIGLAICDPSQSLSSPLEVYHRRSIELDRQYFLTLAQTERVVGWLVGLPLHTNGLPSQKSKEATEFGNWLAEATGLPVDWYDERFTTAFARDVLNQSHLTAKKRKSQLDKLAAQILLSHYLESRTTA